MSKRASGRQWLQVGVCLITSIGFVACSQATPSSSTTSITEVPVPPDDSDAALVSDDAAEAVALTAPLCLELIDLYDDGKIEPAVTLEQSLVDGNDTIANRAALGVRCSEMLREEISMALIDVSLILDELESDESVSDRTLNKLTGGECWLISGAYSGTDALVEEVIEDDLAGENVVGQHCAALFADADETEMYAPLLTAMDDNANLSHQDCWLLRGAYDAEVGLVKDAIGETPSDKSELSSCNVEFDA